MPKTVKVGLILLVILFVMLGVYLSLADRAERLRLPPARDQREERPLAYQTFREAEITVYSEDERQHWILEAELMQRFTENERITMEEIVAHSFEEEQQQMQLEARSGELEPGGDLVFYGPLEVSSLVREAVLSSEQLRWDPESGLLTATGSVELIRPGLTLTAQRLVAEQGLEIVELEGDVQTHVDRD